MENIERREVERNYSTFTNLEDVLPKDIYENTKPTSQNTMSSDEFNEEYKSLLETSVNPVKDNSLNYLFENHENGNDKSLKRNTERKFQKDSTTLTL